MRLRPEEAIALATLTDAADKVRQELTGLRMALKDKDVASKAAKSKKEQKYQESEQKSYICNKSIQNLFQNSEKK